MPTGAEENTIPAPPINPHPQPNPNQNPAPAAAATLPVSVATDKKAYGRGEAVRFTITVRNAGGETQSLLFTSGQFFDLAARRAGAAANEPEAWRWAIDKAFTQIVRRVSLRAGEARTFSATWDQAGNDGQPLATGSYVISGEIAAAPRLRAQPVTIELNQ